MTLTPDADWINDPARVWPVSIDPDVSWDDGTTTIQGTAADTYVASGGQTNYTYTHNGYMHTGYHNRHYKSLIKFDVSSIPDDATVTSSELNLWQPVKPTQAIRDHKLRTITSSWNPAEVTWNKRDDNTSWTTGGGDVSTDPTLTSAATSVKDTGWYTWTAPTAAVQGWVDGTLDNNGFQLAAETSPAPTNAYTFATNEASTTSSYPATSAERPILEISWEPGDDVAPDAPSHAYVATSDFAARTAEIYFNWPKDNGPTGADPSGVAAVEYRVARRSGSFGAWADTTIDNFTIGDVEEGDLVSLQLRTRDNAGNRSASFVKDFETFSDDEAEDENFDAMAAEFSAAHSVTTSVARSWLEAQARVTEGIQALQGTPAHELVAGLRFDHEVRKAHIMVTDDEENDEIEDVLDYLQVLEYVEIDVVAATRADLEETAVEIKDEYANLFYTGKADLQILPDLDGFAILLGSSVTSTERGNLEDSLDLSGVAYDVESAPVDNVLSELTPKSGTCSSYTETPSPDTPAPTHTYPYPDPDGIGPEVGDPLWRHQRCNGTMRGGIAIYHVQHVDSDARASCTSGFTSVGGAHSAQGGNRPYSLTAGHCIAQWETLNDEAPIWGEFDRYQASGDPSAPEPIELGLPATEIRYNGYLDIARINRERRRINRENPGTTPLPMLVHDGDSRDIGAFRLTALEDEHPERIGPWIYRYDTGRALARVRGVASSQKSEHGIVPGKLVCMHGSRTSLTRTEQGRNCAAVIDVVPFKAGPDASLPGGIGHRIMVNSCGLRPGDSGGAATDSANLAVGIISAGSDEQPGVPADPSVEDDAAHYDWIERTYGITLDRCPNGGRGFSILQPADEAARDMGMRILTNRWTKPADTQVQLGDVSRVSATWNRRGDIDLHVFDELGNHVGRTATDDIPDAALLANANRGFGPEEFVERANTGRKYTVGVCYFAGEGPIKVDVELRNPDATSRTVTVNLNASGASALIGSTPDGSNVANIPTDFCDQSGGGGTGRGEFNPGGGWRIGCFKKPQNNFCIDFS